MQSNFNKLKTINLWEVEQFAYLLEKLKATTAVDGSNLLDCSCVFFSSEISDGDRHNHWDMPVLLAGNANGYFQTGQHINYASEQPVSNLFMSMLDAVGATQSSFGNSTGLLNSIGT